MADINKLSELAEQTSFTVALAGNPNVGKSTVFSQLSGTYVTTANYPGKTVELNLATTTFAGTSIGLIDLPGTYALGAISEDQWVARRAILDGHPDVVAFIVDATNLSRNLYMVAQFLDLQIPMVVGLNLIDQARQQGILIDSKYLAKVLGVPVIETVAVSGEGLDSLMKAALEVAAEKSKLKQKSLKYGNDIEEKVASLAQYISTKWHTRRDLDAKSFSLLPRALSLLLLENDPEFRDIFSQVDIGREILRLASSLRKEIADVHGEDATMRIARERHGLAGTIALEAEQISDVREGTLTHLWRLTTSGWSGIPILLLTLFAVLGALFYFGNLMATALDSIWAAFMSPVIQRVIMSVAGKGIVARTLVWGFDSGIEAALSVGIPYVMTFYFFLALMEDTGYLNSAAFLTDRLMHRLGLHGRAIIPLVAGAGCSVPAIIGTRTLTTQRERTIASTLIVMTPCSARTSVILGAVSRYLGIWPAMAVFAIILIVIVFIGYGLNKVMPGSSTGLVMEMFPFRRPSLPNVLKTTWWRVRDFLYVALPIVIGGSLALGALYESGYVWLLSRPLAPVIETWLGLPAVAGLALIFAVLRKELALQLLVTLAIVKYGRGAHNLLEFMDGKQLFVYALVNTLYMPCAATIAVLGRELGWRRAVGILLFTVAFAIVLGGIVMRILNLFW